MLHTLKLFHCLNCNSPYSSRDIGRYNNQTKFPLILPCNHAACESCLLSAVKNKTEFVCSFCKNAVDLPDGNESINKLCPDIHALGVLTANRKKPTSSIKVKMLPSNEMTQKLASKQTSTVCEQCREVLAFWQCDECQKNFCNLCFDKVHKDMKGKKKHEVKKIYAELYNTMVQAGCHEHRNKNVEFYCEKDDQLTCSHCMLVGNHIGHDVKTLVDKNKSCAEGLKAAIENISNVEKRLKYTAHLLSEVTVEEKMDVSEHIKTVHDHFHKLHSLLQVRETEMISRLENLAEMQNEPFEKMMFEISGYEKDIVSMKRDAESVIENPCLAISAPYLLKKLEKCQSLPCYLLPIQTEKKNTEVNLELSSDIEDVIQKYGLVDYTVQSRFHLVSSEELPENYCLEIPESFCVSDIDSQSVATLDTLSEDSLISPSSKYGHQAAAFKYHDFRHSQPEKVLVSYIKDPSCFWVQRIADIRKLNSVSNMINNWCRTRDAQRNKPTSVEKGDLYLVYCQQDKKWYRGRVKRILEPGETYELPAVGMKSSVLSKEKRKVKSDDTLVDVFLVDWGKSEVVPISNMLNIQSRFLNLVGMSKQCSLVDIAPASNTVWSNEAIKSFSNFVSHKPVIMQVYEERNNVLFVDLSQVADNAITNDVPVSVRDALVFQEFAVFPTGTNSASQSFKSIQSFMPPERLKADASVAVIVSHVESPSHLYVQQISTACYLSSLIVEMNEAYKQDHSLLHTIYAPRVGMICAAQFSLDRQWYRAQVISLPGGANVQVQYVDFGNSEIINHKYIRKLSDRFCKLNTQAIPCKLADITYNQEIAWSAEAKEWLTKKVSKKHLILKSRGFILGENKIEAVLYYNEDEYQICVNALIVEAGLASSCGPESTEVQKISLNHVPSKSLTIERLSSYELEDEPILPPVPIEESKPPCSTIVKSFPDTEGKRIEVHISCVINPSLFYVRIAGDMEKKLKKMMSELQKAYTNFEGTVGEPIVGKSYAVYSEAEKKWFRGTILSQSEEKVKVLFVDYGLTEEVPSKNVQKLLEIFSVDEEFAVSCELTGIVPAGGSSEWSFAACDAFKELVAPHEIIHLCSKGEADKEGKSLLVSLFAEETIIGGALEPTKIIFKNIALELVNCGLALPIRSMNPEKSSKKSDDCIAEGCLSPDKEMKSPTNQSGSPLSWADRSASPPPCTDQLASPPQCTSKSPVKACIDKQELSIKKEPKEVIKPKYQWKPVVYPVDNKFKGFVTNIGEDGSIHLHVLKDGSSMVDMIKKALQFKYARADFQKLTKIPPVGEACVAKFSVDSLWYRAEILNAYPNKAKVNFVDYGNNEIVTLNDIRTDIIMQNFPKQCLECLIFGIHAGKPGQWDEDLLNFLHSQLVESIVEVETLGPPDSNGKLPCHIVTSCGISIAELLESMGFMDTESQTSQACRTFQKATELREGDLIPVCVTQIPAANIVYLQRLKIPEPKSDYEKEYNKEHELFLKLIKDLQTQAESFPPVDAPVPGLACCAKYSYDNNWYRCEITDLTNEGVVVLYVDYGNTETVPFENLRNPSDDFINFPVQVHFCEVHGMAPVESEWDPKVIKFMIKKLLISGLDVFAKVVVPGKISQVDILVKIEDGELKLAYEELVENNLIKLHKDN